MNDSELKIELKYLCDKLDEFQLQDKVEDIELLERTISLVETLVINFKSVNVKDVERVSEYLLAYKKFMNMEETEIKNQYRPSVQNLLGTLEKLLIERKFLLGESENIKQVA